MNKHSRWNIQYLRFKIQDKWFKEKKCHVISPLLFQRRLVCRCETYQDAVGKLLLIAHCLICLEGLTRRLSLGALTNSTLRGRIIIILSFKNYRGILIIRPFGLISALLKASWHIDYCNYVTVFFKIVHLCFILKHESISRYVLFNLHVLC